MTILGFVSNIEEWMSVSDVIATKPGGLTLFEAMALKKPLVLLPARGGQEQLNREWAIRVGAAVGVEKTRQAALVIDALLNNPNRLAEMAEASARFGRPDASARIARRILKKMDERGHAMKGGSLETLPLDLHLRCAPGNARLPG